MRRFDLVIFDNDGVLVDSEPIANRYLSELLGEYGLEVGWHDCVERYLGSTLTRVRELVEAELGGPHPGGGLRGALPGRPSTPSWPSRSRRCPGVAAVLDDLDQAGVFHLRGLERAPPAHPRDAQRGWA